MRLGFVGLGKMGGNMVLRLTVGPVSGCASSGHTVVGYAPDPNPALQDIEGVQLVSSLDELVKTLQPPRVVWVMVPAGDPTESVITSLCKLMSPGDVVIDGGNSYFKDSVRRAHALATHGMGFLDVGTSGGIWGREEGYCMMVGGAREHVERCRSIFDCLAPADGWGHVGPSGSGHFVKMVHNGIEYGLMEAYAEGFELLFASKFNLDLHQVAQIWNRGSVVRSWLLELVERMLAQESDLKSVAPFVQDSGEGRWTIQAAIDESVPVPVIATALFARFSSRDPYNFSARFAAGLRNQFGGHPIREVVHKELDEQGIRDGGS